MIELGLERISRLLARKSFRWRTIHVAGTNGKGSICAYISRMLDVYNQSDLRARYGHELLRHGRFTSPHLVDRWDCITINQKPIPFKLFEYIENSVRERNRRYAIGASEFELLTATAFKVFNNQEVDVGVVEVGMGGRLDATNVLNEQAPQVSVEQGGWRAPRPRPLVAAFSNIALDHQAYLGDTLEEIAREKAGIIGRGVPVVYDTSNKPEVVEVIRQTAAASGCSYGTHQFARSRPEAELRELAFYNSFKSLIHGNNASPAEPLHVLQNLEVALNATCVALRELHRLDLESEQAIAEVRELAAQMIKAAKATTFPGRQQKISIEKLTGRKQNVLLDGAHNAQSAFALASAVDKLRSESDNAPVTWFIAASSTKDPKDILSPLLRDGDAVFAVAFGAVDGMPWVKPFAASDLLDAAKTVVSKPEALNVYDCGTDILSALKAASQHANGGPLVIAGSLYLVGDVLRLLRG